MECNQYQAVLHCCLLYVCNRSLPISPAIQSYKLHSFSLKKNLIQSLHEERIHGQSVCFENDKCSLKLTKHYSFSAMDQDHNTGCTGCTGCNHCTNCTDCTNSDHCTNSERLVNSHHCTNSQDLKNCSHCTNCSNLEGVDHATNQHGTPSMKEKV
jgi:hypothetical protein